ncbi:2-C-methyl-D-erythritol 2,4-cyclodiphosphate synthase [Candidatus Peregrinibacteria bacterium]|nr:2-C-methyl-D-erythritol 2,4-cyclodiphosphate synthase [Candidatus Peregrinibacteria bacterium]
MNHAIILAAGQSQRMQSKKDKLLLSAGGKPIIYYSLTAFNDHPQINTITIVVNKINKNEIEKIIKKYHFRKVKMIILGGLTRQKSFMQGLKSLGKTADPSDIILVHNAANPLPSEKDISEVIKKTQKTGACVCGHYITSTVKEVDDDCIIKTHDRKRLFAAQTPQAAKYDIFKKAANYTQKKHFNFTDEAMLLEAISQKVAYIEAGEHNFKITTQGDYLKLKAILGDIPANFRVGIGQDSHEFDDKKQGLYLGGLLLKDKPKLKANSDGDVILHTVFNAISQAIGGSSLGFEMDKECKKGLKNSKNYIKIILEKIHKNGFKLNSLGIMIEAKTPKIDPISHKIKKSLSATLGLSQNRIGITATSGEELTAFGQGLGIQCFAIVSLVKI